MGTIRSGGMPRSSDEEATVVSVISRPPILRIRHERRQVLLQGVHIQLLHFDRVVKVRRHGVGTVVVGLQRFEVEAIWEPVLVGGSVVAVQERALASHAHGVLFHIRGHVDSVCCFRCFLSVDEICVIDVKLSAKLLRKDL